MITDISSKQYAIVSDLNITNQGLLVTNDNCIAVALGSQYGAIGTKYEVELDNGKKFSVIKADEKSDRHTVNSCIDYNSSIIEFIIDTERTYNSDYQQAIIDGDFNSINEFSGVVKYITRKDK